MGYVVEIQTMVPQVQNTFYLSINGKLYLKRQYLKKKNQLKISLTGCVKPNHLIRDVLE